MKGSRCRTSLSFSHTIAVVEAHLEMASISNHLLEDLCHVKVKQAASAPLRGDALTPLADLGSDHPEGLWLEAGNLLMPFYTEVEGGRLTWTIGHN